MPSLQQVDLSSLSDGWNTLAFGQSVDARKIRLDFSPTTGGTGTGIAELEFWGEAEHRAVVDGFAAVDAFGRKDEAGQLLRIRSGLQRGDDDDDDEDDGDGDGDNDADEDGAVILVSNRTQLSTVARFDVPVAPSEILRAWLFYDVRGVESWHDVRRAINGHPPRGGYTGGESKKWSSQIEQISPELLVEGINNIAFSKIAPTHSDYRIRRATLVVELDDGAGFLSRDGIGTALSDGVVSTGWRIQPSLSGMPPLTLPLAKLAELDALHLVVSGNATGRLELEARWDGSWRAAGAALDLATLQTAGGAAGTPVTLELDGAPAEAIRLTIDGQTTTNFIIGEAFATGSGVGPTRAPAALALTSPIDGEFYDRTAYLRGFVAPAANGSGPAEMYVGGLPFDVSLGEFEIAISKDQVGYLDAPSEDPWSVSVDVIYPDGETISQVVSLSNRIAPEGEANDLLATDMESDDFEPGEERDFEHDDAVVSMSADALSRATEISISRLSQIELAKLDNGLVNVTRGPRAGYRMLPDMRFGAEVGVEIPYDKLRVPQGYTDKDVQIFYFDEDEDMWRPLPTRQINEVEAKVSANTTHFTDFIAGVVVAPESPQTASFNPTQIKDIKVADPSARINLVAAPRASQTGDVALSYPIELPPGRQGMAPQLGLQYNSAGGNGWLGMGWNLSMQEISIDTRWGVPRYSAVNETETYTMMGQQLAPVAHRGDLVPRVADRVFRMRVEGSFMRIVRHGDAPTNYWWEITDKMGTRYIYGGDTVLDAQDPTSVLSDGNGNVFKWALRKIIDTNGNEVVYNYSIVQSSGLAQGTLLGSNLYCETITYTGSDGVAGPFEVSFVRDRELPMFNERADTTIDGRGGFKMVTADLLKRIEVRYNGDMVRSYELDYTEGAFFKTLLAGVTQFGADGTAFNTHTFEYFDETRDANGDYLGFAAAQPWTSPNDNIEIGTFIGDDASALSAAEGTNEGGHFYLGFGFGSGKSNSVGAKIGGGVSSSEGRVALIDLNGDGLSDKVFESSGSVFYRANESGPGGSSRFSANAIQIASLPRISAESSTMFSFGPEAFVGGGIGGSIGYNRSRTTAKATTYFTDANGDGFPDLALGGQILFNRLDANGVPSFDFDSADTPYPVGAGAIDAAALDIDLQALFEEAVDAAPLLDTVRRWVAPYPGVISISGDAALIEDMTVDRAAYETADGVRLAVQLNGLELWSQEVEADDYAVKTPIGLTGLSVAKGDIVYFRVQSRFDGAYDQVAWSPQISYDGAVAAPDANGLDAYSYDAQADFVLAGFPNVSVGVPFDGTVRIAGTLSKLGVTTDDVTVEIVKNGSAVFSQIIAFDATTSLVVSEDIAVLGPQIDANGDLIQEPDQVALRISTDSPIDLSQLDWSGADAPRLSYVVSIDPDLSDVFDSNGNPVVTIDLLGDIDILSRSNRTTPLMPWTAGVVGVHSVLPDITLTSGSGTLNDNVVVTVKSGGALVGKDTISIVNGVVNAPSLTFAAVAGQEYFFEFSSQSAEVLDAVSNSSVRIGAPGTAAGDEVLVPSEFHAVAEPNILPQPYRGWNVLGYNGNRLRANLPISISATDLTYGAEFATGALGAREQAIRDAVNNEQIDESLEIASEQIVYPYFPEISSARWISQDDNAWIAQDIVSSSRLGVDYIGSPDLMQFAGAASATRITVTRQTAFTGGLNAGQVSGNIGKSTSDSETLFDFLDLNGDSFPDVVSSGSRVQYSPMVGGLEMSSTNVANMAGNVRETAGESFSFGVGGNYPHKVAGASGQMDSGVGAGNKNGNDSGATAQQMVSLGVSGNVADGGSDASYDLRDVNADGLPDLVRVSGGALLVRFNFGYAFSAVEEIYGSAAINKGENGSLTLGGSIGWNDGIYGYGGGVNISRNTSDALQTLVDVNGDSLADAVSTVSGDPDTLAVRINTGAGFADPVAWSTGGQNGGLARSSATSIGGGAYWTYNIPLFFCGSCSIVINPGADFGANMSRLETMIQDIDGDGHPDYLHSTDDDELTVSYSTSRITNMLRRVNRPLGSTVTVAYDRSGNTADQPQNRYVMSRVEVFDGLAGDGNDVLVSAFEYADGYYDRQERDFYGYQTVVEKHLDYDGPGSESVYRTVTRQFLNDFYYQKGLVASVETAEGAGDKFLETRNTYSFVDVDTNSPVTTPDSLTAVIFPQLVRTDSDFFEGQPVAGKSTYMTYGYDEYGNVTDYLDAANLDTTADDVASAIGYHEDLPAYIVGKADSVTVTGAGSMLMRERLASFETGTGNMSELQTLLSGSGAAVTTMSYDGFGNIASVTGPENATGQRYQLTYSYDTEISTYVTGITDSFGYNSAAVYDARFGALLSTVDLNAQPLTYTLDEFGRVTAVQGPYQAGSGLDTIRMEYNPRLDVAGGPSYDPTITLSWAKTEHIDTYRDLGDTIDTVLFVDGLGRVVQTKKDAAIYVGSEVQNRMVASGRVTFDFLGRQIEQYYPVDESGDQPGVFNTTYDAITPTLTEYDILDRPVRVTIPDGTTTTMAYDFGADRDGRSQFRTLFTDAEGNRRETYADIRKLLTAVKEINPAGGQPTIWTSYAYDPLRQITDVTDDQGNVTQAEYDNFGRMVALDSPDAGRTEFSFDLASNLIAKETANLRAAGTQINYTYDFNRLMNVTYPEYTDNNVTYTYGAPGADFNRANRIVLVDSQAGTEERFYGPLGEVIKTIKDVDLVLEDDDDGCEIDDDGLGDDDDDAPCALIFTTAYTFDTWNRLQSMIYPDGEVLTNQYDSGGKLRQIDGEKLGYDYAYLREMGYDKFGQRVYMKAGNNTETTYAYVPTTRRLDGLLAGNSRGRVFQDISYGYDLVGNITTQANAAAVLSEEQLGGATQFTYAYDDLYRLTSATGRLEHSPDDDDGGFPYTVDSYTLAMTYDSIHNITSKDQLHLTQEPDDDDDGPEIVGRTTYDWGYTYGGPQPHAPSLIGRTTYSYDLNGNQTGWIRPEDDDDDGIFDEDGDGADDDAERRIIRWDEENRIQAVYQDDDFEDGLEDADLEDVVRFKYDDAGQRVVKYGGDGDADGFALGDADDDGETIYINQFMTLRGREAATKHVFAGGSRLVSKLVRQPEWDDDDDDEEGIPGQAPWGWSPGLAGIEGEDEDELFERDQYFFHPDHLGTTSYLTNRRGNVYQHLEYFPFGETFFEDEDNEGGSPYRFTGKELDPETGLYYFGARYYDPRTSVWVSTDPILGRYFEGEETQKGVFSPALLNLYSYSINQPVNLKDPEGNSPVCAIPAGGTQTCAAAAIGGVILLTGVAAIEYGSDLAVDGRLNGNGAMTGATSGLVDAISNLIPEPQDPTMTDLAQAYPFRNPSNIIAMAQGQVTPGLLALAQRAEDIKSDTGTPGQVRVQVQTGNQTLSSIAMASPSGSISKIEAQGGLAYVFINSLAQDPSLAGNPGFTAAIIKTSTQIQTLPAGGMDKGPYQTTIQSTFTHKGQEFRVDVEILRGTQFLE